MLEFRPASRKAVPLLISIASVSGGGKTMSALLVAAGLAGPNGKVGLIDTENGRGEMYADSPTVAKALPNGFLYLPFDPPFTPERYVEHLQAGERAGLTVAIVDSTSHEWEGIGGVAELADAEEKQKGRFGKWASPKMRHKRFVYYCMTSQMHIIFCLRARDKVKMFRKGDPVILGPGQETSDAKAADKDLIVPMGLQPICEKNFVFEMMVSLMLDEHTHYAAPIKVPEPLQPIVASKHLLTKEDGERIAKWNSGGAAIDPAQQLAKRAQVAAADGIEAYKRFFDALSKEQRKAIPHEALKAAAAKADAERNANLPEFTGNELPDAMNFAPGDRCRYRPNPSAPFHDLTVVEQDGEANAWKRI